MKRPVRVAVLLAALIGLAVGGAPVARAGEPQQLSVTVFSGMLSMGALANTGTSGTPCATCVGVSTGGSGPAVVLDPGGSTVGFSFVSNVCARVSTPGPSGTFPTVDCTISIAGQLEGFDTAATGGGTFMYTSPDGGSFSVGVIVTMVGNVFSLVGAGATGAFRATFLAAPNPGPEPKQRPANGLSGRSG